MLSKNGWIKQLKSLAIAAGGAAITFFLQGLSGIDFGEFLPVVVALSSVLVNMVKVFLEER